RVKYVSRGRGYTLFLTPAEAVLALRKPAVRTAGVRATTRDVETLRVRLLGANPDPPLVAEDELAARANYFIGNDPTRWRTNVPTYGRVRYRDVYPGIDLVYYGTHQRELEYDFVLAPGADPHAIALAFDGARRLALDGAGNLVVTLADGGTVVHQAPV